MPPLLRNATFRPSGDQAGALPRDESPMLAAIGVRREKLGGADRARVPTAIDFESAADLASRNSGQTSALASRAGVSGTATVDRGDADTVTLLARAKRTWCSRGCRRRDPRNVRTGSGRDDAEPVPAVLGRRERSASSGAREAARGSARRAARSRSGRGPCVRDHGARRPRKTWIRAVIVEVRHEPRLRQLSASSPSGRRMRCSSSLRTHARWPSR